MITPKSIIINLVFVSLILIHKSTSTTVGSRIIFPDDSGYQPAERNPGPTLNTVKTSGNTPGVTIDDLLSIRNNNSQTERNPGPIWNTDDTNRNPGGADESTTTPKIGEDVGNEPGVSIADLLQIAETYQARNLFPRPRECGPLLLVPNIYGGREAALGSFPWMANLEYRKDGDNNITSECSGNIINQRYVLTAAHCVTGGIEQKYGRLVSLRVGDHNTETLIDCNSEGCIDPFQRFGIERRIVHEEFRVDQNKRTHYDIALLRTDRNIIFSSSVAPICLTDVVPTLGPPTGGMKLTVIGWGHTGMQRHSPVKRAVEVPYVENERCSLAVNDGQICAGGVFMEDSCTGDSGGSLARMTSDGWFIEGIVSYGRGCGLEKPSVYTRVRFFLDWIHDNVEP